MHEVFIIHISNLRNSIRDAHLIETHANLVKAGPAHYLIYLQNVYPRFLLLQDSLLQLILTEKNISK